MKLTDIQIKSLLPFFAAASKYAGWESIAIKLLKGEVCVVAGHRCIWGNGGIGAYISVLPASDYVDACEYCIDIKSFLKSKYFLDYAQDYSKALIQEADDLIKKVDEKQKELIDFKNLLNIA